MTKQTFPFDDLLRIAKNNAGESEKTIRDSAWDEFKLEGEHARALFDYWFDHQIRRIAIDEVKPGEIVAVVDTGRRNIPKMTTRERAAAKRRTTKLVNKAMNVMLMELVLDNGKKLRNCTFGEVRKYGGWLSSIAKMGKTNEIVGKKLTEADLRNVHLRNTG